MLKSIAVVRPKTGLVRVGNPARMRSRRRIRSLSAGGLATDATRGGHWALTKSKARSPTHKQWPTASRTAPEAWNQSHPKMTPVLTSSETRNEWRRGGDGGEVARETLPEKESVAEATAVAADEWLGKGESQLGRVRSTKELITEQDAPLSSRATTGVQLIETRRRQD